MSKFNEILNSSDASDALLGEQIDNCNSHIEVLEGKATRSLRYSKTLTTGGDSYNAIGTVALNAGDILFFRPEWSSGQPTGIRFKKRSDGSVLKTYESTTWNEDMLLFMMANFDGEVDVEVKTNKTNPTIRGYLKVIR